MRTQFICQGCTYKVERRVSTCPMCGALMPRIEEEATRTVRAIAGLGAVSFIA